MFEGVRACVAVWASVCPHLRIRHIGNDFVDCRASLSRLRALWLLCRGTRDLVRTAAVGVGRQEGADDHDDVEGMVLPMTCGVDYIRRRLPSAFVFENATALSFSKHDRVFARIKDALSSIEDTLGNPAYQLHWKILNSKLYGGVPQSRHNFCIVGVLKAKLRHPFKWPCRITCRPVDTILAPLGLEKTSDPDLSSSVQDLGEP